MNITTKLEYGTELHEEAPTNDVALTRRVLVQEVGLDLAGDLADHAIKVQEIAETLRGKIMQYRRLRQATEAALEEFKTLSVPSPENAAIATNVLMMMLRADDTLAKIRSKWQNSRRKGVRLETFYATLDQGYDRASGYLYAGLAVLKRSAHTNPRLSSITNIISPFVGGDDNSERSPSPDSGKTG